jgi:hypothetical protein
MMPGNKSTVVLALLLLPLPVAGQNTGSLLPVRVWFEYSGSPGHTFGSGNGAAVRDAIAKALEPGCVPYAFVAGTSKEQSHLRVTLTREDTDSLSLTAELYSFASDGRVGPPSDLGQVPGFQRRYADGLPNYNDWPVNVSRAISKVEAIGIIKKSLHDNVPFAKGVQLIKVPPPPTSQRESGLAISVPLNTAYVNGGAFDVEYGDEASRLLTKAVGCRLPDNRIVVEPQDVLVHQNRERPDKHYNDYSTIFARQAEILIYPAADFHGGPATVKCTDYVNPKPRQIQ